MQIFNPTHNNFVHQLHEDGFVVLDLLDADEVQQLVDLYHQQPNAKNEAFGFHITLDLSDGSKIAAIGEAITQVINPKVETLLQNFKYISPRFAIKEAHQNSLIPPHQDWSFVDERKYQSFNLWIALTPATFENGTLGFLPKSHNALENIRATPLPIFEVPFQKYAQELTPYMKFVELQAGQAFLFNSRVIHASKPNVSDSARISIATELTDKNAPLKHFYKSPKNKKRILVYDIEDAFFTKYSNAKLTELYQQKQLIKDFKLATKFNNKTKSIAKQDLLKRCGIVI